MTYVFYDPETGEITWTADYVAGIVLPNEPHIEVVVAPANLTLWQVVDGALVQREDADEIERQQARAGASLTRREFLQACIDGGIMTRADAIAAAKGEIPATFAPIIESWTEEERGQAEFEWAALTQVDRLHPLIVVMADAIGLTAAQLDAIFGIGE